MSHPVCNGCPWGVPLPGLATVPELVAERAVAIDPENEVGWYRLAQVQRALGNSAEQEKALAEYRRLHDRSSQQHGLKAVFSPREVTKQEVEPAPQ